VSSYHQKVNYQDGVRDAGKGRYEPDLRGKFRSVYDAAWAETKGRWPRETDRTDPNAD